MKTAEEVLDDECTSVSAWSFQRKTAVLKAMEIYADQFKPQWIDVKLIPNEFPIKYLVFIEYGENKFQEVVWFHGKDEGWEVYNPYITFYKPLPEPPTAS